MDFTQLAQLVSSVGFPIVMCGLMAWYVKYQADQHKTEMEKVTEALNNNTIAIQKLCDKE